MESEIRVNSCIWVYLYKVAVCVWDILCGDGLDYLIWKYSLF